MKARDKFYRQKSDFSTLSYSYEISPKCLYTTNTSSGPYYLANAPVRSNIIENEKGITLYIGLKIVNGKDCTKIVNAEVDIWQANAYGKYSGFINGQIDVDNNNAITPLNNELFLRGKQYSDELGFVEFKSIYPGQYQNRTNHIHLKVFYENKERLTTQLFFPQKINDYIETLYPYNQNRNRTKNEDDIIINRYNGVKGGWPRISPFGKGFIATLTIGIYI